MGWLLWSLLVRGVVVVVSADRGVVVVVGTVRGVAVVVATVRGSWGSCCGRYCSWGGFVVATSRGVVVVVVTTVRGVAVVVVTTVRGMVVVVAVVVVQIIWLVIRLQEALHF